MSRFRRSIAAVAFAACACLAVVFDAARSFGAWAFDRLVFGPPKLEEAKKEPSKLIVRAKAFTLTLVQRQRPRIESTWRMCPST